MNVDIKKRSWDSIFFNIEVAECSIVELDEANIPNLIRILEENDFKLAYIYPKDEKSKLALLSSQIPLVDNKIIFKKEKLNPNSLEFKNISSYITDDNYSQLLELAFESGTYSRFNIDKNFNSIDFKRMYSLWVERSINKEIATDLVCWRDLNKSIQGFISFKINEENLKIGLIAVNQNNRGKGIGRELMTYVENIAIQNNLNQIIVETQANNENACQFYKRNGYIVSEIQSIFHLWI